MPKINSDLFNGNHYSNSSESDRKLMREWMAGILKQQDIDVTFTKVNGTLRKMHCTLQESAIIPREEKKHEIVKDKNEDVCVVWDIDKNEWRSFRYDSIKEIRFEIK